MWQQQVQWHSGNWGTGNDHSAVKLTIPELEQVSEANGWVDVCKETEKLIVHGMIWKMEDR